MSNPAWSHEQKASPGDGHPHAELHALIDGELTGDAAARVQSHLAECADCASEHAAIAGVLSVLKSEDPIRAPEGFASRVMKRTRARKRAGTGHQLFSRKVPYEGGIIVLLAAAAAAAVLSYGIMNRGELVSWLEKAAAVGD